MKAQKKSENSILNFLSSVKLAITIFIVLAVTSIIGTLIPQGESLQFYLERYGPNLFNIIKLLHLNDTYHSWWYLSLLGLFSLNLLVCISRRLPYTIELLKRDSLKVEPNKLERMPLKAKWTINSLIDKEREGSIVNALERMAGRVKRKRSISMEGENASSTLYLIEKGKLSYLGLYVLHFSLLIIFIGAIIGNYFGFGGSIMIGEGETADFIYRTGDNHRIPLGFSVRCDDFDIQFYDTGAPKLFKSHVTIIENDKEVMSHEILVNSPLTYKGVRFYQASYQPIPIITLKVTGSNGWEKEFSMPTFKKVPVDKEGFEMGIMRYLPKVHGVPAVRLWIGAADDDIEPQAIWILKGRDSEFTLKDREYRVSLENIENKYLTGLQVKKDPGVPLVYLGCLGLIVGIMVVFWMPHKKIWLLIERKNGVTDVLLAGQTNKNKGGFKKGFEEVRGAIEGVIERRKVS